MITNKAAANLETLPPKYNYSNRTSELGPGFLVNKQEVVCFRGEANFLSGGKQKFVIN